MQICRVDLRNKCQSIRKYPGTRDADALLRGSELYGQTDTGNGGIVVHFNAHKLPLRSAKSRAKTEIKEAGMYAKGDLFGLTPWLPTDSLLTPLSAPGDLSVDHPGVAPLTVHYADTA